MQEKRTRLIIRNLDETIVNSELRVKKYLNLAYI